MRPTRILLVDDDAALTRLLKTSLTKKGNYEVAIENVSKRALTTARDFEPDIILLDVMMPDQDGGDVAASIKEDRRLKSVPIIFLTSLVSKKERHSEKSEIGDETFLAKPVSIGDLINEIEASLDAA
jgi:DNA-binding response OmpR family regulator